MKTRSTLNIFAFLALAVSATLAYADNAGLQRCRAIADAAPRLACYDALPVTVAPSPSAAAALRA
jgi:hypothetical protein